MTYTPKTFGKLLNRFFEIIRAHWKTLIGVGLAPSAGLALLIVSIVGVIFWKLAPLSQQSEPKLDPSVVYWIVLLVAPLYPIIIFIFSLYLAAIATAATRINRGEEVTVSSAWEQARSHVGRYFWLIIRQMLVVLVPIFAVLSLVIGGTAGLIALLSHDHFNSSNFALLFPLIFLCYLGSVIYGIWIAVRFSFSYFASVTEDLSAAQSMTRSWQLTRNAFWRIFGVIFVVYLMIYAAQYIVMIALAIVAAIAVLGAIALGVTTQSASFPYLVGVAVIFGAAFLTLLYSVIYAALASAVAVLYEDQRMRLAPAPDFNLISPNVPNEASSI